MKYSQERKRSIWARLALIWTTAVPRSAGQVTSYPLGQLCSLVIHQWEEAPRALPGFN